MGHRMCISDKLPGDADAWGPRSENHRLRCKPGTREPQRRDANSMQWIYRVDTGVHCKEHRTEVRKWFSSLALPPVNSTTLRELQKPLSFSFAPEMGGMGISERSPFCSNIPLVKKLPNFLVQIVRILNCNSVETYFSQSFWTFFVKKKKSISIPLFS